MRLTKARCPQIFGDVGGFQGDAFTGPVGGHVGVLLFGGGASVGLSASLFVQFESRAYVRLEQPSSPEQKVTDFVHV